MLQFTQLTTRSAIARWLSARRDERCTRPFAARGFCIATGLMRVGLFLLLAACTAPVDMGPRVPDETGPGGHYDLPPTAAAPMQDTLDWLNGQVGAFSNGTDWAITFEDL